MRMTRVLVWFGLILTVLASAALDAQAPQQPPADRAQLSVTVEDPSGAVIVGAKVTLTGLDEATRRVTIEPAQTTGRGIATFDGVAPGKYRIEAAFAAFESAKREVTLRRGDNRQSLSLGLKMLVEETIVGQDPVSAIVDPKGGYYLTAAEIADLPDDPVRMRNRLLEISGAPLVHVDGFPGATLPSKAQIKSIHIIEDPFAAENHSPNARVEVVTQIKEGPRTGGFSQTFDTEASQATGRLRFQGGSRPGQPVQMTPSIAGAFLNDAVSPFASAVPQDSDYMGGFDFASVLIPGRSSIAVNSSWEKWWWNEHIYAAVPQGIVADVAPYKTRYDYFDTSVMIDSALGNNVLRFRYDYYKELSAGGVEQFNLPAMGDEFTAWWHTFRLMHSTPLGARGFWNSRFQYEREGGESHAPLEGVTVQVLDAFTGGGAQAAGGGRSHNMMFGSDVDYVRGIHAFRGGLLLNARHINSAYNANYLGTYVFESLDDFEAGRPRAFTRAVGDPRVVYWHREFGAYVQDDIRLRKNLVLSPGLRYEGQLHVTNVNWAPRVGLNWAPGTRANTAIRLSWGIFYDWMLAQTYERALRLDGNHQTELAVESPSYPTTPSGGLPNLYRIASSIELPRQSRTVANLDRNIGAKTRVSVSYTHVSGSQQWHGQNLNAAVDGVRPNPLLQNVIEAQSGARFRNNSAGTSFTLNLAGVAPLGRTGAGRAGGPGAAGEGRGIGQRRVDWRRQQFTVGYSYNRPLTDTEGPFYVAPTGSLSTEWAPPAAGNPDFFDIRHSARFGMTNTVLQNLTVGLNLNRTVGAAYTQFTARDTNRDLIFNDRPDGVGRMTLRGGARITWSTNARYSIRRGLAPGKRPYTTEISFNLNNLADRHNYGTYSGVMLSPFYQQPLGVLAPRFFRLGFNITF